MTTTTYPQIDTSPEPGTAATSRMRAIAQDHYGSNNTWQPTDIGRCLAGRVESVALRDLIESGRIAPSIDRTHALSEAAEAIAYVHDGKARGKAVITMRPPGNPTAAATS